ncbi:phytoene desaturase family protein [Halovenus salina]|uniref:Phytoene desaturase family protein n=2 Tax=Halovenus salina TaxID=1510225 RepID=A0ABD5W9T0_9EURY
MDGLDEDDLKTPVFEHLGVFENVDFEQIDQFYRYVDPTRGTDITVPHGPEAAIDAYAAAFPEENAGIRKFINVILTTRREVADWPFFEEPSLVDYALAPVRQRTLGRYRKTTLGELLDDVIDDESCKLALGANLGYYHDDPYELSLPFFAVAQGGYIDGGSYYVRGGSQRLSDYLVSLIEENGGAVDCGRLVSDIHVRDGWVSGATHAKTYTETDEQTTQANSVIANAAVPTVAENLLADPHGSTLAAEISDRAIAPSLTTLYLVFEPTPADLGNECYSTIIEGTDIDTLLTLVTHLRRGSEAADSRSSTTARWPPTSHPMVSLSAPSRPSTTTTRGVG